MTRSRVPLWVSKAILTFAALLFSVIGVAMLEVADQSIEDANWVSHTQEVIANIEDLQTIFLTAESSIRAHVVSGNAEYKEVFTQSIDLLPSKESSLQALVIDNPMQVLNVQIARDLIAKRLFQMNATLTAFQVGGVEEAKMVIQKNTSATNFELRKQFLLLLSNEQNLLLKRKAISFKSFDLLKLISVSGIPIGLIMVFAVYTLLSKELKNRIAAEKNSTESNIEVAKALAKLEVSSSDLQALSDYGSYLQSCHTIEEALRITVQIISRLAPDSSGEVYLMKASKNIMELSVEWGKVNGQGQKTITPSECWCIRRSKPNFSEKDSYTPQCDHITEEVVTDMTWLCLELASQGTQLGLVTIHAKSLMIHERFSVIEAAMEQLALSLNSLQLRSVLEYQSTRDDLTGLYNRRYMDESFRQLHARSIRHSEPYSLLMIDVDHFKKFNDTYGHEGGDIVLREIGKILTGLRAEDIACRYGGEELTIALPNTNNVLAEDIANRLREKIQAIRIEYNKVVMNPVTVSIGVASFPDDGEDNDDIRKKADAALYSAKRSGRNKVVSHKSI